MMQLFDLSSNRIRINLKSKSSKWNYEWVILVKCCNRKANPPWDLSENLSNFNNIVANWIVLFFASWFEKNFNFLLMQFSQMISHILKIQWNFSWEKISFCFDLLEHSSDFSKLLAAQISFSFWDMTILYDTCIHYLLLAPSWKSFIL